MKKRTAFKSAVVLMLAIVMMLIPAFPALAAGENQIVISAPKDEPGENGRFVAYQVFKGALEGADEIKGIEWGSGVDSTKLLEELTASTQTVPPQSDDPYNESMKTFGAQFNAAYDQYTNKYSDQLNAAEFVAQWLGIMSKDYATTYNPYADAFARAVGKNLSTQMASSKKSTSSSRTLWTIDVKDPGYYLVKDTYTGNAASVSSYILRVLGTATVTIKASIPTVEKKVEGQDGYLTGTYNKLTYTLTGTVSANISEYSTYTYKFTDTLSPGLTADLSTVEVTLSARDLPSATFDKNDTTGYTANLASVGTEKEEHILTVEFKNLLAAIHTAAPTLDLTNRQVVDSIRITVSYEAELNEYAVMGATGNKNDVVLEYSNDPYNESTGKTVPDEVLTYGIGLQIKKIDADGKELENIEFKLQNEKGEYATFKSTTNTDGAGSETYYAITDWGNDSGNGSVLTTDGTGIINIHGLDIGKYTLTETKTKEGLELMQPIVFYVDSNETGNGHVTSTGTFPTKVSFRLDSIDEHRMDVFVENNNFAGHSAKVKLTNYSLPILPHTGGIGRMVVLAISGAAVLAGIAVIFFALRRKGGSRV